MVVMERARFLDELVARVGEAAVIRGADEVQKSLKQNSWLSPVLLEHFSLLKGTAGQSLQVDAVVSPADVDQLRATIALAVRHAVPMTVRGGGTSNFGQTVPLKGGIIVDTTRLDRILEIADDSVTAEAGALQGDVDKAARAHGRELGVLTTTYASATVAGWVAGGHVGIGAPQYGTIWDGNVRRLKLLTAEDPPRELTLEGDDLHAVLHTYGTTGIITEVTFPLVPARDWLEAVAVFDTFEAAARFTAALTEQGSIVHRIASALEAPMARTLTPIAQLIGADQAAVLLIIDAIHEPACRDLVRQCDGIYQFWKRPVDTRRCPLAYMVYGHRMLWIKKQVPQSAFLHCYLAPDAVSEQLSAVKDRFGPVVWLEIKYMRSRWFRQLRGLPGDGMLPSLFLTLVPGDRAFLDTVMAFCDSVGITYQNPHTFVLEEAGVFLDFDRVVELKRRTDPGGLLNPGKIGARFFAPPGDGDRAQGHC